MRHLLTIDPKRTIEHLVLARYNADKNDECIVTGDILTDAIALLRLMVAAEANKIPGLTPIEDKLYRCLAGNGERGTEATSLMVAAGIESRPSLWVHMRRLRCKLPGHRIETIQHFGYRLIEAESEVTHANNRHV